MPALPQKVLQDTNKSFQGIHQGEKMHWISPTSLWNSTTVVMLLYNLLLIRSVFKRSKKISIYWSLTSGVSFVFLYFSSAYQIFALESSRPAIQFPTITVSWKIISGSLIWCFFHFKDYKWKPLENNKYSRARISVGAVAPTGS